MSRGLGKVEREVLDTLEKSRGQLAVWQLTRLMYEPSPVGLFLGERPSDSPHYSSVKRAVRSLERKGLVKRHSTAKEAIVRLCVPLEEVRISDDRKCGTGSTFCRHLSTER